MTTPDKLSSHHWTIVECENWLRNGRKLEGKELTAMEEVVIQLADVMRENERLTKLVAFEKSEKEEWKLFYAGALKRLDQQHKHSEDRDWNCECGWPHKQCGIHYDQTEPPFVERLGGICQLPYTKTSVVRDDVEERTEHETFFQERLSERSEKP